MRVIKLHAENFKRLFAVDITPHGDVVTITGRNMQGKSSVLDALWSALAGVMPSEAIRQGAERALLRVDLGKYIVTRTISKKKDGGETTAVKVESADGAVFPSPQRLLDELIGKLSFDPLYFARLSETKPGRRQQFDMLAKFVEGIDFDAIANLNRGAYDKRTDVNRRAKEAAAAASVIMVPEVLPERVDEQGLVAQLSGATAREAEIAEHGRRRDALQGKLDDAQRRQGANEREFAELQARLKALQDAHADLVHEVTVICDEVAAFPAPPERVDSAAVAAELSRAQTHNRNVAEVLARVEKRASMQRLAESLEKEADDLTAQIDARLAAKAKAISEAKMPVEGIGFGDGEVLLNGVPFAQGSSAEQLRTSVAIAAALNPTLRVIHIRDGSLLDDDAMAWLAEYAKTHDLQVWCEVVGTDEKVGILIEDGRVKSSEVAA